MKVSIVIPTYNEAHTIEAVINAVLNNPLTIEKEVLVIDDGSTDNTSEILKNYTSVTVCHHEHNQGKGAAIKTGVAKASGNIILIQDADTEYSPADHQELLRPLIEGVTDVVYGSRFIGNKHRVFFPHTYLANRVLSFLVRQVVTWPVTDMETCLKAFHKESVDKVSLLERRFGIEPEITIKLSRIQGIRYQEVPISYTGRSIGAGKKIRWYDGIWALWCIIKYGLLKQ